MMSILAKTIKLYQFYRYQAIFMLSMALYHSTQFYTNGEQNLASQDFLLINFSQITSEYLEGVFIILTLIMLFLILAKSFFLNEENYFIEIMDKLLYPIQIYTAIIVLKDPTNAKQTFRNFIDITFLIFILLNTVFFIIKNTKISLRYANSRQKGMNRIFIYEYCLLSIKLFANVILALFFPEQKIIYILIIAAINILINGFFYFKIFYEHPKIEYLCLLTQFYQWTPLLSFLFTYFESTSRVSSVINIIGLLTFFSLGFIKPQVLLKILQRKYIACLEKLEAQSKNNLESHDKQFKNNIISVLSVFLQIFFQESNNQKLQWSNSFKNRFVQFIKGKTLKLIEQPSQRKTFFTQNLQKQSIDSQKQDSPKKQTQKPQSQHQNQVNDSARMLIKTRIYRRGGVYINEELKNYFRKTNEQNQSNYHSQLMYELIWGYVYPFVSSKSNQFRHLRFYVCYNFPDTMKYMRYRLFHSYYFNYFDEFALLDFIQANICYTHLLAKIGGHTTYKKSLDSELQIQDMDQSVQCLHEESSYYHPMYNDALRENEIKSQLIKEFQKFHQNEQLYLKIFQNMTANKENIRTYYSQRRQRRINIQSLIQQYSNLRNKNNPFLFTIKYINDYFVHKNHHQAHDNFQKAHINFVSLKKHYLRQNINQTQKEQSFNQRIVQSIKNDILSNKNEEQNTIVCVLSGLQRLGQIKVSSSKFKELMDIDPQKLQHQLAEANPNGFMNHFHLPIFRLQHSKELKKIQSYEKPMHHLKKRNFLQGNKGTHVIELKFKMYFFMKLETDLHLVLDIKYEKLDFLQIKDSSQQIIFTHRSKSFQLKSQQTSKKININNFVNIKKNQEKPKQQKYQYEETYLFGELYYITTVRNKSNINLEEEQFEKNTKMALALTETKLEQDQILNAKKMKEHKFMEYKQNFDIFGKQWNFIKMLVISSVFFFGIFFQILITQEYQHRSQALTMVQDKLILQNEYLLLDSYSSISIGVLFDLVTGNIWFAPNDKNNKRRFLLKVFKQIYSIKVQMQQKYVKSKFDNSYGTLAKLLYQDDWIPGYNISFMSHALMKEELFYEALSIFLDPLALNQNGTLNVNSSQSMNTSSTIQIILPTTLSSSQSAIIFKNLLLSIQTKTYNFDANGVLDHMFILEKQMFTSIFNLRVLFFICLEFGFTILSVFIIFFIVKMKKSLLDHYNEAILVSDLFVRKFSSQASTLQNYILNLKGCLKQDLSLKIKPQKILCRQQSRKRTYIRKVTDDSFQNQINQNKKRYDQKQRALNLPKYLMESVLFPFLRYFVVLGTVYYVYQMRVNKTKILEDYSNNLSMLSKINTNFVQALGISLYEKTFESDDVMTEILKEEFTKCIKQIGQIDKVKVIDALFPYNPDIAHSILYESANVTLSKLQLPTRKFRSFTSFLEESNHLILSYKALFNHLTSRNADPKELQSHYTECYTKVSQLFWYIDQVSEKSYELLNKKFSSNYTGIYIGIILFLVVQLILGCAHFIKILTVFNEEYLNLATYQNLQSQPAFGKFVNLSQQNNFFVIQQDQTYLNQV